jgi:hypothetical protein
VALAANGGVATASSTFSGSYPVTAVNDGDRKGLNWGAGGGWNDATANAYPDWVQIDFSTSKTINEIDFFTIQDNYTNPVTPTLSMQFTLYGVTDFQVQYWTGSTWANVPSGNVTGNRNVWRQFTFANITTSKIRVLVNNSLASYSRVVEIEAYQAGGSPTPTPTPTATPAPTPNPTPTPTATLTPTPQCTVPNFIGIRLNRAQALWNSAGFTTTVIIIGGKGQAITSQSLPPGYIGSCKTTTITLTAQ